MAVESRAYRCWRNMIARCYSKVVHEANPSYRGCEVCEDWKVFEIFEKWYLENYIEGYHLDKDTKVPGNKIYSPDTCLFISAKDNCTAPGLTGEEYTLQHPDFGMVSFENQREFSREYGLDNSCVSKVLRGDRKTHKGWGIPPQES